MIIKPKYYGPTFWDGGKSLDLYFARDKSLDPRITFTRASSGTYFDASGVLQTATTDVARFDHNPVTRESLGLLLEVAATNLLTYSEDFSNAAWTKLDATVSSNATIAPDGTLTADKIVEAASTASHAVLQTPSSTSTAVHAASVYLKAAERAWARVSVDFGAGGFYRFWVNLSTGAIGSANGSGAASVSVAPSSANVGNGWWRVAVSASSASGSTRGIFVAPQTADAETTSVGDGVSGIYTWGAQLETGSRASSYIKTVASTVTRAADSAIMTGTNFSSWYNQAEGTFVMEVSEDYSTTAESRGWMTAHDGALTNSINMYHSGASVFLDFYNGGAYQVTFNPTYNTKAAIAYKTNDSAGSAGGSIETDSVCVVPSGINQMIIGSTYAGNTYPMNGCIKRLTYYPRRLTNGNLQELTS